jgi:methylglutaconyl-CoA hydratase
MSRVLVELRRRVGWLTLARPEKKNALDLQTAEELLAGIEAFGADPDVRVIAVTGQGDDFCAGADLAALEGMLDAAEAAHLRDAEALGRVFLAMRSVQRPVVAVVRGRALAGGAGLATACDIVLADEQATFGYPEVRVGFVPAMVMTMLRCAAGEKHAFELVATGRRIHAAEAHRLGLVSRVLAHSTFDAEVEQYLTELATSPPNALALTKKLFYALHELDFRDGIAAGVKANVAARATDDFREGLRRFTQRPRGRP